MRKTLACLFLASLPLSADEDAFRERFADPETRAAALAELIPGTRDAYFHTALAHQLAGREAEFRKTMTQWKAAVERKENPVSASGMSTLENRQLLTDYGKDPKAPLAELIRRLDLKFDDARPNAAAAAESLPTRLDPALISEGAFEKAAAEQSPQSPYEQYKSRRLLRELERVETFDDAKIKWFLENLQRADLPGVVPLIDRALSLKEPVAFENIPLREKLTSSQLASLLDLHPALKSNLAFDCAHLAKLRPGAETDFDHDLAAHAGHLAHCRDYVLTLPPALNSLKAHVLFHHLRLQAELGNYPKDDFLTFLAFPRQSHPILRPADGNSPNKVSLGGDYHDATGCPPIRDDRPLIEEYLNHFLGQTDSAAEFAPFVEEKRLNRIHARARLLAGADTNRWGSLLDPAEFKALQEESSISFAPGAPKLLASDTKVSLTLDLKRTPDLLIRIYEIDLPAHLARHGEEPSVNLDLDGLVPHHQRHLTFAQAPIVRHRESIDLPELAGPGVWLVDFVSGQVSARAMIRKGRLVPYLEQTADGQIVRVFDETGNPVQGASVSLGRETFAADATGRIRIPNASGQPVTQGMVTVGKLAADIEPGPRDEKPELEARFHLDREQLLADLETQVQIRMRLTNRGHELPLDRIKEPALVLRAELLGGITTERVIAENLALKPLMEIPFQVPADLLNLTFTLRGTVTPTTGGDPVKLTAEESYRPNGGLKNSQIGTLFFAPTAEGHRLEVRGRNGEPLPSREITLSCSRYDYGPNIIARVRSDANGRVDLGALGDIDEVRADSTGISTANYLPKSRRLYWDRHMNLAHGTEIRLPLETPSAAPDRLRMSLLEIVDQHPIRDHFDKLSIDNGDLLIRGLPPGDYQLQEETGSIEIHVSPSQANDGLLVSASRILPLHQAVQPFVASATTENGQIVIQLRGQSPETRVSLVGKRYAWEGWSDGDGLLPFPPTLPDLVIPGFTGCGYLTDRRLSDETRYILDRRAAKTFPGSMLPRPGMLLNRWTEEDTRQNIVTGGAGSGGSDKGAPRRKPSAREERGGPGVSLGIASTNDSVCDFLATPAVTRIDLTPDAGGMVKLPLDDFKDCQFVEITATDAFAIDSRKLPLPARDIHTRDRRIARPLDPKIHYQATRSTAVLAKEATASIENVLDADWRAFNTLADAHQFLFGMLPDDRLREFVFLTDWPTFTEERKLELLSQHACHELHLFLFRKDRPFFDTHVKPLLAQKAEPTFIDDFLLGRGLTGYLRPYAWQRLNAAEKALLGRAFPDAAKRINRELSLRWELERPSPEAETNLFTQTLRGTDLATTDSLGLARNERHLSGLAFIRNKLKSIIIPRIDFENVTVEEAVDFLRMRATELDTLELDPSKRGISFVIRRPRYTASPGTDAGIDAAGELPHSTTDPGSLRIRELRLRNVPLSDALKYICDQTKLRYKIDDYAITLVPQTETGEDIFQRQFSVPPDFISALTPSGGAGDIDPFAEPKPGTRNLTQRMPVVELLKNAGINFPEGASAQLTANGTLLVTNDATELDKIEQLVSAVCNATNAELDAAALPELPPITGTQDIPEDDPFAAPIRGGTAAALRPLTIPRFPEHTKLWHEADYYRNTQPTDERLIPLNRFWLDLAAWDGKGGFLSPHFNACHTSANEALMCLALLDLPFKADRPEVAVDGSMLKVKAKSPMLLFYKDTRKADVVADESPLLVRQSFSPLAEKTRTVDGRQVENPVTGDFHPGVPYAMSLVVTNPTGIGRRLDVLAEIPAGAIPLGGNLETLSTTREIQPHGVLKLELAFYFPAAGDFAVYPLHVSENGVVLASTSKRVLRASNKPELVDAASWSVIASEGSENEVLNRLRTENLKTIDLKAIRWRLKDRAFFLKVTGILRERLFFDPQIADYGFHHGDAASIREYLENTSFVSQLGQWFDSPLLDVRPRVHHDWHTLEFDPLVNPRAHRFTNASRLTDTAAREHYHAFLDQLAWKRALDDSDQLTLTAFLFLQDRIEEALNRFARIDPAKLPGRVNYDYLHAVALFYQEKPDEAKAIAAAQLPSLPPGLWHDRFQTVIDQADEIAALAKANVAEKQADEEAAAPRLELAAAGDGRLLLKHRGLEKATLRLFSVDLEMLFSKDPFLQGGGESEPSIQPNEILVVPLAKDAAETPVELPAALRKGNVLVSAESGSTKLLKVLDSRAIELRHLPQDRTVQVTDAATGKPLARTYVKVYAEDRNGEVVFHKDGYTDLRGKFDYLSHTGVDISTIKRVALLASHPDKGARTVVYDR